MNNTVQKNYHFEDIWKVHIDRINAEYPLSFSRDFFSLLPTLNPKFIQDLVDEADSFLKYLPEMYKAGENQMIFLCNDLKNMLINLKEEIEESLPEKIDTIVLAGGFAKRLSPFSDEIPKPLIPVCGKPVLGYFMDDLEELYRNIEGTCYLTVNKKFSYDFETFLSERKYNMNIELIVENAEKENNKLGPLEAIRNVAKKIKSKHTLIKAGDNLSSLTPLDLIDFYIENPRGAVIALYDLKEADKASEKYGVAEIDSNSEIISFYEKPKNPRTSLINTTFYFLEHNNLMKILDSNKKEQEAGSIVDILIKESHCTTKGCVFDNYWFDIGDYKSLAEANRFMRGIK